MAKMWDIRRREMHIQCEREKGKKTGNRIFQQGGMKIFTEYGYPVVIDGLRISFSQHLP
jgi:hypothetical protein